MGLRYAHPFSFVCSSVVWDSCFSLPPKILPKTLKSRGIFSSPCTGWLGGHLIFAGRNGQLCPTQPWPSIRDSIIPCVHLWGPQAEGESSYLVITEVQEGQREPALYWDLDQAWHRIASPHSDLSQSQSHREAHVGGGRAPSIFCGSNCRTARQGCQPGPAGRLVSYGSVTRSSFHQLSGQRAIVLRTVLGQLIIW